MGASRKAELDESKFGSVTAGMVIRKGKSAPTAQAGNGSIQDQFPGGFLVRKGEATPSPIDLLVNAVAQFEGGAAPAPQDSDENRRLREELGRLQSALMEARTAAERARESWTRETEDLLLKAKQDFQAQAKQWMAEEARHQEEWTNALAALTARCEQAEALVAQAHAKADTNASAAGASEAELRRLRDEHTRLRTALTEREAALAETRSAYEQAEQRWRQEHEEAGKNTEQAGQAEGAARLAALQAQWQSETTRVLADARAQAQAALDQSQQECLRLRDEAASLQTVLKDRESALAQRDVANGQARENWQKDAADALLKAEQSWKDGEAERLAARDAQWQQQLANALAQATARSEKAEALLAETTAKANDLGQAAQSQDGALKRLREECTALLATIGQREAELAELRSAGKVARETSVRESRESQDALRKAEQSWKAAEAARLSAAETAWRETSARALAEARGQADAAQKKAEGERDRLRQELAALQAALSESANELAQSRQLAEKAQLTQAGEAQEALRETEQRLEAAHAARLAAAESEWNEKSARALTEARAHADTAQRKAEDESGHLRVEVSALQKALSENANELAQLRLTVEKAQATQVAEAQEALRKTEQRLEADYALRLAAAETEWSEEAARALAEAHAEAGAARQTAEDERDRLRLEVVALQGALSENADELAKIRVLAEKVQGTEPGKTQDANDGTRLAAAEAQWKSQSAGALADARARYQAAEAALAQLRAENDRARSQIFASGKNEANSMRLRMGGKAAAQPEKVSLSIDLDRRSGMPEARTGRPNGLRDVFKSRDEAPPSPALRSPVRDVSIAAALGVLLIFAYPNVAPFLPESLRSTISSIAGITGQTVDASEDSGASVELPLQDAIPKRSAVVLRDVNLRANPSTAEAAISKLSRGIKVVIIEQRGSWTKVQPDSQDGKTPAVQGWVSNSFLKAEPAQQTKPQISARD